MFVIRTLSLLGAVIMTVTIVLGFLSGGFMDEGSAIWALSWGKVTLIDLYVGLVFFGIWVSVRERRLSAVVLWWAGLVVLGNLAAALYLVYASFSASSVRELLTGERVHSNSAVVPEGEVGR
jgi:uncharacterized membrane protein